MSLSKSSYDKIMRGYENRRRLHERAFFARKETFEEQHPELSALSAEMSSNYAAIARARILQDDSRVQALTAEGEALAGRRDALLKALGVNPDTFSPEYTCPLCKDTGYVGAEKCSCFKAYEVALLYEESGLSEWLSEQNFDKLSTDFYDRTAKEGEKSEYESMLEKISRCKRFAENFDAEGGNLLLVGPTGSGKTFLSVCIAKALLDTGHSVAYFSAVSLIDLLSTQFPSRDADAFGALNEKLLTSDLLVIDDLGTEFINSYTISRFFEIINERLLHKKSTVISSNLDWAGIREKYSERISSRIISNYETVFVNCADIRLKKTFSGVKK